MKTPYPKHLHNTHLIPSIKQREQGVKPKSLSSSKNYHQQIINSDGFRDQIGLTNALSDIPDPSKEMKYIHREGIAIEYDPNLEEYQQCLYRDKEYEISKEITFDEYLKKLETYCRNKFPVSNN